MKEEIPNKTEKKIITGLARILCLIIPVAGSFLGYVLANFIFEKQNLTNTETLSFLFSLGFFIISSIVIFFKTRNTDSIVKARVS